MGATPHDQVVARAAVLWRRSGDQILIRRRGNDEVTVLAGTACSLWDALESPHSVAELTEELSRIHATGTSHIVDDVQAAIDTLVDQQVVALL